MKIKILTKEQIIISIDRLTRFKNPETKYLRVFKDIILHNLISPCYSKLDLDSMPYDKLKNYAQNILNNSIDKLFSPRKIDLSINKNIADYEKSVFEVDKDTEILLNNEINYASCSDIISDNFSKNLRWLKELSQKKDIKAARKKGAFLFPIEIVVITEGVTEETLLPEFARLCDFDFDKNGVYIIPAGGKNQVVKLYYELQEMLKIPIFILLDRDGEQNAQEIEPKLRVKDVIHVIECGEFEDALSKDLVNRTLVYELQNISEIGADPQEIPGCRVKYLEEIFKNRGRHEFKKADFSQMVKNNIVNNEDLSPEIVKIIDKIKNLKSNY